MMGESCERGKGKKEHERYRYESVFNLSISPSLRAYIISKRNWSIVLCGEWVMRSTRVLTFLK